MNIHISHSNPEQDLSGARAPHTEKIQFLSPSRDPESAIERLSEPGSDPIKRMWRPGFDHLMSEMPVIDPRQEDQSLQVAMTAEVLSRMAALVEERLPHLNLPHIGDGQFGRVILAIEEPKEVGGKLVPGTEIVLAIWGKGFASPVHGHAAGYLHEQLIQGAFDVHLFRGIGESSSRLAVYDRTIQQTEPGIFYSEFKRERGQEKRSEVIHNFVARQLTYSLHYLPEHVRNGVENMFSVVNTPESGALPAWTQTLPYRPGFEVTADEVTRATPASLAKNLEVGDTFLVRSKSVPFLGPHFAVITSTEFVEKPHGLRPQDVSIPLPHTLATPLDNFGVQDTLVLLKLNDAARDRLHEHYGIRL